MRSIAPALRPKGFTLLETVVSLTLFATAGLALYALFNTNLLALNRVADVAKQEPVVTYAMQRLATVNPWQQQQGRFAYDGFDVVWQARLAAPVRQGQSAFGQLGDYDIGLYDVDIEVRERDRLLGVWRMRLIGHDNVRGLPAGEFPLF